MTTLTHDLICRFEAHLAKTKIPLYAAAKAMGVQYLLLWQALRRKRRMDKRKKTTAIGYEMGRKIETWLDGEGAK